MKLHLPLVSWLFFFVLFSGLKAQAQQVNVTSVTPTPVCAGATITASYSYPLPDPGNVVLYLNGPNTTNIPIGAAATNGNNGVVAGTIPADRATGSYTVFIRRTSNILPTPINSPASTAFTVNERPAAPGVSSVSYCLGATGVPPLTATGQNLKWYTNNTDGTGTNTAPTPPTSVAGTTNYYVSQTNASGCEGPRATLAVTVNPRPAQPTVVSSLIYCQYSTASSLASVVTPGSNLKWYTTPTGGIAMPTAPTPSTTSPNVVTYYVSQTNENGCESDRASITITIKASPNAPAVMTPVTFCQSQPAAPLSATPVSGASLNWFGPANNSLGGTAPTPSTSTPGSTFYSVSQSLNGCTSPVATIAVTINAKPAMPATVPVSVCQATTPVSLATGVISGMNLRWYTAATGGIGSPVAPTPPTSSVGSTTYYVSQTDANGCQSDRASITYTVNPSPTGNLANDGPLACIKPSVLLTATGAGAGAFTYRFSPGASQQDGGNRATVTSAGVYSVTVISAGGCTAVAQTTVTEDKTNPSVSLIKSANLGCTPSSVTLTASGGRAGSYRFSAGASQVGNDSTATVTTPGVYIVIFTAPNGCFAVATATVEAESNLSGLVLTNSGPVACGGGSVNLAVSGAPAGSTYRFSTGALSTGAGNTATVTTAGVYSVTVTSPGGCSGVVSTSVTGANCNFAITGVTTVSCEVTDAARGQRRLIFTPQYTGLTGAPVSFAVQNELSPTTTPGPYTLRLYSDNPVITLIATQAGSAETRFSYNWREACSTVTPTNRPPVAQAIPSQILAQGEAFNVELTSYITDPDGQPLTFSIGGQPSGLALNGSRISGTATATGISTITVTALDPAGLQVTTSFQLTITPLISTPAGFTIVGVTTVSCQTLSAGQRQVQFLPQYGGVTGQAITFQVTNELAPTQQAGPYTLNLYTDNPIISLLATQTGGTAPATYRYNWLEACGATITPTPANRAPAVGSGLASQTATVGQDYTLAIPTGTFSDPDGDALTLTATGLPPGVLFAGSALTGTPATTGASTVTLIARDPAGLEVSLSFTLTVVPASTLPPTTDFAITEVNTVTCEVLSAGQRRVSFTPQYSGVSGSPISFSVVNELNPTTAPGPYSLALYTDNPVITLKARQGSSLASYRYEWLAACATGGRQGAVEAGQTLQVTVLGNPVVDEQVGVEVRGAEGQFLRLQLTDLAGRPVSERWVEQARSVEFQRLSIGPHPAGILLLRVSTLAESQTVKVLRR